MRRTYKKMRHLRGLRKSAGVGDEMLVFQRDDRRRFAFVDPSSSPSAACCTRATISATATMPLGFQIFDEVTRDFFS
jgi:hypothetical protein